MASAVFSKFTNSENNFTYAAFYIRRVSHVWYNSGAMVTYLQWCHVVIKLQTEINHAVGVRIRRKHNISAGWHPIGVIESLYIGTARRCDIGYGI